MLPDSRVEPAPWWCAAVMAVALATTSGVIRPAGLWADDFSSDIRIEIFASDAAPVTEGGTVSGTVTGRVTVRNANRQHAQVYKNFRVVETHEPGHEIDSDHWVRTFTVDTTEFYDGENLISVHVHPMNVPGQPYIADFAVQAFTLVSANGNPAPTGDVRLPTLTIDPSMVLLLDSTLLDSKSVYTDYDAVTVSDDLGRIDIDQDENTSNRAQVIPHLGTSVLGRFRWTDRPLPFGESPGRPIRQAHLVHFQRRSETPARIVFFVNDAAGRANYGFHRFVLPSLSEEARRAYPLPSTDVRILNVSDGDEIIVPDGGVFTLRVEVTNPASLGREFPTLSTWVGNRSVAKTDLAPLLRALTAGETSVIVDIDIPASEIQKLEASRDGGVDATAFVLWNDFDKFRDSSLPASGHVHLNSIRTASYPWPE